MTPDALCIQFPFSCTLLSYRNLFDIFLFYNMTHNPRGHHDLTPRIDNDQFVSSPSSNSGTPQLSDPLGLSGSHESSSPGSGTLTNTDRPLKQWWALPFASHARLEPKHDDHRPKHVSISRLKRGQIKPGANKSLYTGDLLEELGNPNNTPNTATMTLSSSPSTQTIDSRFGAIGWTPYSSRLRRLPALDNLRAPYHKSCAVIENIARDVRAYLAQKRHDMVSVPLAIPASPNQNHHPKVTFSGEQTEYIEQSEDTYLINGNDITAILDIMVSGLKKGLPEERSLTGFFSKLLPQSEIDKPSLGARAIIPQMPIRADPATTISSVQPTFSSWGPLGNTEHEVEREPPKSTFISRQSVTEVK